MDKKKFDLQIFAYGGSIGAPSGYDPDNPEITMEDCLEMRRKRANMLKECRAMLDKAEEERRDLTEREKREYSQKDREIDELGETIKKEEARIHEERRQGEMENEGTISNGWTTGDGSQLRVYAPGEEMRFVRDTLQRHPLPGGIRPEELSLGRAVRSMITGDWSRAQAEQRAMATTPDASGGYLVPAPLSAKLIGLALNRMQTRRAGVAFTPMDSKTLTVAKVKSIPAGAWLGENIPGEFEDMTFDAVTLTAKKLMVLTSLSIELAEDGQNIEQVIENALAEALALEMDRAALVGSGVDEEPKGVINTTGIQEIAHGGTIENYDVFSQAYEQLQDENEEANALLWAPKTAGVVDRLKDTLGQPLKSPQSWENFKKYSTKQIPTDLGTGSNESVAFLADWRQLLWGLRTDTRIEVTRTAGDAFKAGQVWIRAYLRGDVAIARPKAFLKITGIQYPTA